MVLPCHLVIGQGYLEIRRFRLRLGEKWRGSVKPNPELDPTRQSSRAGIPEQPERSDRVALVQITHDLAIGGLQQIVVNLCRFIDRQRFDVSVLCLRRLGELAPEIERLGIPVTLLPGRTGHTDYFAFLKVARVLRHRKAAVLHTHNTQPLVDGTLGGLLAGVRTVVHTDHARQFPDKRRYMLAEWVMSHFVHRMVGVSDHTSQNLMKYEHVSPRKIVTIPNGIDGSRYDVRIDPGSLRREFGLEPDGPIIGACVRLTEQKGITFLLQAMTRIRRVFPRAALLVAGQGGLEPALRQEARDLGIDSDVRFLGARLDVPALLRLFDVYALPSIWEGLPLILLEAMAAGCPIVGTDVGGVPTAVEPGVNGLLVRPGDPDALAEAIIQVLSNPSLAQEFASRGLDRFQRLFSAEAMARRYEALYLRQ